jgi:hypothetical protein
MTADRRRRLADDAYRTTGLMASVIADARRARAEIPDDVTASITVWRSWADRLDTWATQLDAGPPDPPTAR